MYNFAVKQTSYGKIKIVDGDETITITPSPVSGKKRKLIMRKLTLMASSQNLIVALEQTLDYLNLVDAPLELRDDVRAAIYSSKVKIITNCPSCGETIFDENSHKIGNHNMDCKTMEQLSND